MPASRREFLLQAAAAFGGASAEAAAPDPPVLRLPSDPRNRLSVTSWPFRAYIESKANHGRNPQVPGMDLKEFPALVAKKFGVFNINPLADHFRSTEPAYLVAFRKAVAKARSNVVGLGLGGKDFCSSDPNTRDSAVNFGRIWIDRARVIGSPSVRQHLRLDHHEKPNREHAARSLGRLAEYGAKRNIVINLENDNPIAEDPFLILDVIEKVDSPYLRALPDFGNCLLAHDREYNERAVAAMFRHSWNMCHVKDAVQSDSGEVYSVNLRKMFEIAKENAYSGYFSMEFDLPSRDAFEGTRKLIRKTLQYLT